MFSAPRSVCGSRNTFPGVVALLQELFGKAIAFRAIEDPELAEWTHIVIEARLTGTIAEAADKQENYSSRIDRPRVETNSRIIVESDMKPHAIKKLLLQTAIVILALAAISTPVQAGPPATPAKRPNILFIMADDHAAHAISAYGGRINQTPQIDRIARDGMRFDRCFCTNSICTPSRACILTGKYSHKNGVPVFNFFDGSQPTAAKYLQAAGYYTGMIGKWHLGSEPTGFDRWTILPGQGVYHDPLFSGRGGPPQDAWLRDRHHHRPGP